MHAIHAIYTVILAHHIWCIPCTYPPGYDRQPAGEDVCLFWERDVLAAEVRKEGMPIFQVSSIHTNSKKWKPSICLPLRKRCWIKMDMLR